MPRTTIVIVEDEPTQRMDAEAIFNEKGFSTVAFDNGAEASSYVMDNRDSILALFTDVRMEGGSDGLDLAAQIAVGCPQIRLLVTSGQPEGVLERMPPNSTFVPKPWTSADLADVAQQLRPSQA